MRVPLKSFHRPVKVWPTPAVGVLSLLIIGATLTGPATAVACDNTQRSVTAMPPCTTRVTVNSNPCGAMIYVDGIQVGRTPMSFPMPTGRYTLFLLAPGHQQFAQRILVQDAPLKIDAKLVPEK